MAAAYLLPRGICVADKGCENFNENNPRKLFCSFFLKVTNRHNAPASRQTWSSSRAEDAVANLANVLNLPKTPSNFTLLLCRRLPKRALVHEIKVQQ